MFRYFFPMFALVAFTLLSACETMKGAGRDIESAGQAITDTAVENE